MGVSRAACIADLQKIGRTRLPGFVFNYIEGGAGEEAGVARNERALARYLFRPRRLGGGVTSTEVTLLGRTYKQPFGIPPVGMSNLAWPGTDLKFASLAQRENMPYVLSTMATTSIEKIAAAAPDVSWFQLYISKDDGITFDLLKRAWDSGMRVLALTIDTPNPGRRNRSIRDRFGLPFRYTPHVMVDLACHPGWSFATLFAGMPVLENYAHYAKTSKMQVVGRYVTQLNKWALDWNDFQRVRDLWKGKLLPKGVQDAEDATELMRRGADGIWVSNHGGRQLEAAPAAIDSLATVRAAVGPTTPVLFDSGIRCGEDILKARALGADMVFAGRAFAYAAAAGGPAGVEKAFEILSQEVVAGLGQIGCPTIAALNKSWLLHNNG
jgi:isopentenyl diphosphate isomerase/L-lactate dehydrogenase-like FMN-dependent dehydrogenase